MLGLNHRGQSEFVANVTWAVISGIAVLIRLICKIRTKQGIHWDDYWILASLAFYYTAVAFAIWGIITGGGGMEIEEIMIEIRKDPKNASKLSHYLESLFIAYTFVLTSVFAVKLSILYFYRRVFCIDAGYKLASLLLILLSTAWFVSAQIANLVTCIPIDSFWHRTKPGKCFNFSAMYLGTGTVDTLIDFAILILPMHMAYQLHLPTRTRIAVGAIFALGGFVIIAQIVRMIYIYQPHSQYGKFKIHFHQSEQWTNIHNATAIICACLPIYKPLWSSTSKVIGQYANSIRSRISKSKDRSKLDTDKILQLDRPNFDSQPKSWAARLPEKKRLGADPERAWPGFHRGTDDDMELLKVPEGNTGHSRRINLAYAV